MKKIFYLFIALNVNLLHTMLAAPNDKIAPNDNALTMETIKELKGQHISDVTLIYEVIDFYLDIQEEGKTKYIYNPDTENIIFWTNEDFKCLEIKEFKDRENATSVKLLLNDEYELNIIQPKDDMGITKVSSRTFSEKHKKFISVITFKKK
ncbi:hypothetical protein [Flammeovirga sp. SubArs3]|uniref:hypothetical protein n=1 Tax=Flammeovirga sp. SubArs3 TaxID=2995316 RepID=UPI00248B9191|nr:hypothetical protein [Flammeovirga sp. SubArs3]